MQRVNKTAPAITHLSKGHAITVRTADIDYYQIILEQSNQIKIMLHHTL